MEEGIIKLNGKIKLASAWKLRVFLNPELKRCSPQWENAMGNRRLFCIARKYS